MKKYVLSQNTHHCDLTSLMYSVVLGKNSEHDHIFWYIFIHIELNVFLILQIFLKLKKYCLSQNSHFCK